MATVPLKSFSPLNFSTGKASPVTLASFTVKPCALSSTPSVGTVLPWGGGQRRLFQTRTEATKQAPSFILFATSKTRLLDVHRQIPNTHFWKTLSLPQQDRHFVMYCTKYYVFLVSCFPIDNPQGFTSLLHPSHRPLSAILRPSICRHRRLPSWPRRGGRNDRGGRNLSSRNRS